MHPTELAFRASSLWDEASTSPIALVLLDRESEVLRELRLPPCPVIGIGASDHPMGAMLDTVVGADFDISGLVSAAIGHPLAAGIAAQLLRMIPALGLEDALTAESLAYATLQASEPHRGWIASRSKMAGNGEAGRILLERDGGMLTVILERQGARNAIDRAMRDGLHEAFALVNADPSISKVVLRANGKTFSVGADLDEFGTTVDPAVAHAIRWQTLPAREAARCADRLEVRVDGACIGAGLELAAYARTIVATRRSWFQLPELAMGILPGAGGCVSLCQRIGRQRTLFLLLSGKRLSASAAVEWGLVDTLVDELP